MAILKIARSLLVICLSVFIVDYATAQSDPDKAIIGIGKIESSIRGSDPYSFQTMLETQLIKTNKFKVIERNRIEDILREQGLSETGLIDSGVGFGSIEGIDYMIYGSITKLGLSGSNVRVGGFSTGSGSVEMEFDLRIVDVSTGEIRIAETVAEKIKGGGSVKMQGFSKADARSGALGDVQRATATAITGLVVTSLYPAKVAAIQKDGTIVINYGNSVFTEGDIVKVFNVGEGFTDPDTGEILGSEEVEVAVMQITQTHAKYSKAELVSGEEVARGDVVRIDRDASKKDKKKASKKRGKKI